MNLRVFLAVAFSACMPLAVCAQSAELAASAERQLPALTDVYKQLHRNPELSHHEEKTSAFLAGELRKLGYTVTEHVGKYPDSSQAFGIVGILENGAGPRLLLRTELDALPVEKRPASITLPPFAPPIHRARRSGSCTLADTTCT